MSDIIKKLKLCAEPRRADILLNQRAYLQAACELEDHWERFKASLTPDQLQTLDALQYEECTFRDWEDDASFQAGLSIGLELGRL